MTRTESRRTINAPVDRVFETVSDINNFSKAVPGIVKVEVLSDVQVGVGTRFRETRLMNGKEATTELEVTEFVENEYIRIVSDTHGTIWDSVFTVKPSGEQTELLLVMDAKPYKVAAKLTTPLIKGPLKKALEQDMDAVKAYCEKQ